MPGPNGTASLDDFTRADAATLGGNYGTDLTGLSFHPSLYIVSNQAAKGAGGGFQSNYWLTSFAQDQEIYHTVVTMPNGNAGHLLTRIVNPVSTTCRFYQLAYLTGSVPTISRVDDCTGGTRNATLLANCTTIPAAGNKVAFVSVGDKHRYYIDTGSGWVLDTETTDATYVNSGFVGFWLQNSTAWTFDDFGGGAIVTTPNPLPIIPEFPPERFGPF